MVSSLWAITRNSFIEIIRQPIYIILLVAGIILVAISPYVTMFGGSSAQQLMTDMGLATILLLGVVLGVINSSQVIHRQIESRTAGAIMSKPVGRLVFLVGQFVAVTLAMAVAVYVLTIVVLLALRMGPQLAAHQHTDWIALLCMGLPLVLAMIVGGLCNFFFGLNFSSTAVLSGLIFYTLSAIVMLTVGPDGAFVPRVMLVYLSWDKHIDQVALAALLIFLATWVLSSFAVAVSTRANTVLSAIITVTAFFVFLVAQFLLSPMSTVRARVPLDAKQIVDSAALAQRMASSERPMPKYVKSIGAVEETRQETEWRREGRKATLTEMYNVDIALEKVAVNTTRSVINIHLKRNVDDSGVETPAEEMAVEALTAIGLSEQKDYLRSEIQVWPDYPLVGRVFPHLYVFWVSDKLMADKPVIPVKYVGMAALYALGNCLGLLALAAYLFEGRDLV